MATPRTVLRMGRQLVGESGITVSTDTVHSFPVHSHTYYELILYPPFAGAVTVNDTILTPDRGFAVLMTPADLHSVRLDGSPASLVKIAFAPDLPGRHLLDRIGGRPLYVMTEGTPLRALFERISEKRPFEEQKILLRTLLLCMLDSGHSLPALPATTGSSTVAKAIGIIHDEAHTDLTLAALAERLNISYQHLSASFSEQLGLSFSAYLTDIRLRNAKQLLDNTELSVTEICFECGYHNLSHFLRSFKKKYGTTPKEYRKK